MLTKTLIALFLITSVGAIAVINHNKSQTAIVSTDTSTNESQNPESTEIVCEVSIAEAHKNSGDRYGESGQFEEAIAEYTKAISLKPKYKEAYENRALLYNQLEQYHKAIADYKKLIDIGGMGIPEIKLSKTLDLLMDSKQLTAERRQEIADATKEIESNPQNDYYYSNRADIYRQLKQYDLALADYDTAISIEPQNLHAYAKRGSLYHQLKRYDLALADYNTATSIEPTGYTKYVNYDYIYSRRADTYINLKQYDKAIADYSQTIAISKMPGASDSNIVPEAYNKRANIYRLLKQYDKAIADYSHTISNYPRDLFGVDTYAYRMRADTYKELKQYDLAIADYTKVIAIYSGPHRFGYEYRIINLLNKRAAIYSELKQYDKAIADYNEVISVDSEYVDAYKNRGDLYRELGQIEQARVDWEKASKIYQQQNNCEQYQIIQQQLQKL